MGERQGGEENEMQREGTEMQRGRINLDGNEPGDEEDRDCPCWKCWNNCKNFGGGVEEERRGLTNEMQNEEGEEERRGQTNEMQREGAEVQREGGAEVQRGGEEEGSSVPGLGCDLQDHLQGGGQIHLLGSCK